LHDGRYIGSDDLRREFIQVAIAAAFQARDLVTDVALDHRAVVLRAVDIYQRHGRSAVTWRAHLSSRMPLKTDGEYARPESMR
jgi:hypothetical protein